jgi:hypothetical protein
MARSARSPLSRKQLADLYYLEMRAKLLDVAAFLDRLDRAQDAGTAPADFRVDALRQGVQELSSQMPERAARIQLCLSDPTTDPIPDAAGLKAAAGAYSADSYRPNRGGAK